MYYIPNVDLAFSSVEYIMRELNYGWLIRYVHANGASMFFIVVYIHMFRGLFFSSFMHPRELLWVIGVLILFLMIIIAFMGYVLPWGQMSYWGATVITNLFTAIPILGAFIVTWLWGGFTIGTATIGHFFGLHILLSFILVSLVVFHIFLLHQYGSNSSLGNEVVFDFKFFYPFFIIKDVYGLVYFFLFYSCSLFFFPNYLGHSDNYIMANSMVTPSHIVPEWYFLPFYAILRGIPDKLFGVLALLCAILILFILPYIDFSIIRSSKYKLISNYLFWFFFFNCLLLGWLGGQSVKYPFVNLSQILSLGYFDYFILTSPIILSYEKFFWEEYFLIFKNIAYFKNLKGIYNKILLF
jgi:ubiquinol-cytochrome c reductase cytochrome b subunit